MLIFQRYTWWVGAMVGLAFMLAVASQLGVLGPFEGAYLRISTPIERVLSSTFRPVAGLFSGLGDVQELRRENQALRLENEQLRNTVVELQQEVGELADLREALGVIGDDATATYVPASVVSRDGSAFADVVNVDRGSNDGIRPDMVVLSPSGSLVGRVTSVTPTRAAIRLISDSRSTVNAQIPVSGIDGTVRGSATKTVRFELARGAIAAGDVVVTSGVGGNYPRGLPVGTVASVRGTPQDLFLDVVLEPQVRLSTLETVLIRTDFDPTRRALETE